MKKYEPVDESTYDYFKDWQLAVGGVLVGIVLIAGLIGNAIRPGIALPAMILAAAVIIVGLVIGLVSWIYHYLKGERR